MSIQNLKNKARDYTWSVLAEVHEKLDAYLYPRTKNKNFYYPYEPTTRKLGEKFLKGDLWFDTKNRYSLHSWNGNRWVKVGNTVSGT